MMLTFRRLLHVCHFDVQFWGWNIARVAFFALHARLSENYKQKSKFCQHFFEKIMNYSHLTKLSKLFARQLLNDAFEFQHQQDTRHLTNR